MRTRLLWTLGLASLLAVFTGDLVSTRADDKPQVKGPTFKDLMKQAIEAANKDNLIEATKLADQALAIEPNNREGLFLLGVLTNEQVKDLKEKPLKIAMLRKSAAAFDSLRARYQALSPAELSVAAGSKLNQARALALEGKVDSSLAQIASLMATGFDDFEAIDEEPDLEAVRQLPAFKVMVAERIKADVIRDLASFQSFPFDFDLKGLDDKPVKLLADYKGKVTIVDFWGTWCPPCRAEIPSFVDLYQTYKAKGLEIVGINCGEEGSPDEVKKTIKDFALKNKVKYQCVLNNDADEDNKTEKKVPSFRGYPTTLFLDRTGKVRMLTVGITSRTRLETIVTTLLAEPVNN